jgi:decaprenyl-phosphate phosphoribosyltransferase
MADPVPTTSGADPGSAPPPPASLLSGLIRTARPKQWMKNVLVVAAPAAAGVLNQRSVILDTIVAFVAFSLAASGTYFLNDAFDVEADRRHAKKRFRPIAAGIVPLGTARVVGILLLAAGIGVSFLANWRLALVIGVYVVFTTTYSAWLKHVAVIDLGMVAAGFVLRLIAGAVAVDVRISVWFIVVGSFGSLFMVAGKRHAEHLDLGDERAGHRATLEEYSLEYLGYVRSVASGVAMVAYCLWAFDAQIHHTGIVWFEVSIVPFVLAFLRYALLVERGQGGAPEDVVLMDRPLQTLGVLWVVLVAIGLYVA